MRFKVGDKVTIRPDLREGMGTTDDNCVVIDMEAYMGVETKITKVNEDSYRVDCDDGEWYWPEEAFLPEPFTNADKIRSMSDEELAKNSVVPFTYLNGYRSDTIFFGVNTRYYADTVEEAVRVEMEWLQRPVQDKTRV